MSRRLVALSLPIASLLVVSTAVAQQSNPLTFRELREIQQQLSELDEFSDNEYVLEDKVTDVLTPVDDWIGDPVQIELAVSHVKKEFVVLFPRGDSRQDERDVHIPLVLARPSFGAGVVRIGIDRSVRDMLRRMRRETREQREDLASNRARVAEEEVEEVVDIDEEEIGAQQSQLVGRQDTDQRHLVIPVGHLIPVALARELRQGDRVMLHADVRAAFVAHERDLVVGYVLTNAKFERLGENTSTRRGTE